MTTQLTISIENLNNNTQSDVLITASNFFMLLIKVNNFYKRNIFINSYRITTPNYEAGNNGTNSGAYLIELLEEQNK